ncbi:MAG: 1,2-phenylacetyl-CoA epoxidase subunit PaaC [Pseudomonadota bacterium]
MTAGAPRRNLDGIQPGDDAARHAKVQVNAAPAGAEVQVNELLAAGDDHLVLGHRLSEWCGHAPMLEEDLALPNMGLDMLGQARALYSYAAELEGRGRSEDDIAYLRVDREYRNCLLVERPNGDFAHTMLRQFYFAAFMHPFWQAATASIDDRFAAIAAKAEKEIAYHVRHAGEWVIRLGDGTEESARRMRAAVEALHPYTDELFVDAVPARDSVDLALVPSRPGMRARWDATVGEVFSEARLEIPEVAFPLSGGRQGRHGEEFGYLLAELQYMQRTYPGLQW